MDNRKNVKVQPHVKLSLDAIKHMLDLPNESLTIDYLCEVYLKLKSESMTVKQHNEIKNGVQVRAKQMTF